MHGAQNWLQFPFHYIQWLPCHRPSLHGMAPSELPTYQIYGELSLCILS
uniref:Uncharacterized protein n=1 Tax=Rhizophora mucronata TaxID=61149 RepID=A0A2P2QTK9_RHIMU